MIIKKNLLPIRNRTHGGKIIEVRNVVVHWAGNAGQSARGIRKWFELIGRGPVRIGKKLVKLYASCHYVVGLDGSITQLIEEDTEAYTNGGRKYTDYARLRFRYGKKTKPNKYCVSIECAHPDWGGKFTNETESAVAELCEHLLKKYGLGIDNMIRHYDITMKKCPRYYVNSPSEWQRLKNIIIEKRK